METRNQNQQNRPGQPGQQQGRNNHLPGDKERDEQRKKQTPAAQKHQHGNASKPEKQLAKEAHEETLGERDLNDLDKYNEDGGPRPKASADASKNR